MAVIMPPQVVPAAAPIPQLTIAALKLEEKRVLGLRIIQSSDENAYHSEAVDKLAVMVAKTVMTKPGFTGLDLPGLLELTGYKYRHTANGKPFRTYLAKTPASIYAALITNPATGFQFTHTSKKGPVDYVIRAELYTGEMISKERNLDKYTSVTIVNTGGTATDKTEDISAAAKAIFSTIGADLADLNQGKTEIGVPIDKWYSHFTMKDGLKIPGYELYKVNTFQATTGNNFKCYFTSELLADFKICTHCLKTADYCIHSKSNDKRPAASSSSTDRAEAKRRAIAKHDQRD